MQSEITPQLDTSLQTDKQKFLISMLNGTAVYVLAYYFVWGVHQIMQAQLSRFFHLRGTWDPSRIAYTLAAVEWWPLGLITINSIGPLVCLLVGIAAFLWYWRRGRAQRGQFKLLLLWVAFHSCNVVFGALLTDTFLKTGFWHVSEWVLQMGNTANVLVALLAGLLQAGLGYIGSVAFLQAHDSITVMRLENRRLMVMFTLIIPWLAGSIFIALSKLFYFSLYEGLHLMAMGVLVIPTALGSLNEEFSSTVNRPRPTYVVWGLVGLAVIVAVAWRLALTPPVVFK
ncbi:hypothetical protein IC235_13785 [Hymenobacter sp. BT664]|uniref:Uncharacterized protein n=1 Tax=Hymenobacter montanus TaxID=2771359 RepID=A0A927BFG6_9BACT|nr:hypothetical protein [Hymenobacter montanus]MBD2768958.1 hypothetical protein [Hymenobacter montanus]